jgi:HEAT repeat protein
VWKTTEYADEDESGALFLALQKLKDPRAVMPMVVLIEDQASSADVQSSAASVLSVIGDPRGLDPVLRLAQDRTAAPDARAPAIRCLGRFQDPRASAALAAILAREDLPIEERQAAADGLRTRCDPATRPAIMDVLRKTQDRLIRLTLIQTVADIGTAADVAPLQSLAAGNPQLKTAVDDAIEDIQSRARSAQPTP